MLLDGIPAEQRDYIIARCRNAPPDQCLDYQEGGNIVLKIDSLAVKFGSGVSKDEAENQAQVSHIINQNIVRVPKVHDWFQDSDGWGYLVMEFMAGKRANHLGDDKYATELLKVIEHLHSLTAKEIGPLHQGPHRAILFGEGPSPVLKSTQDVEAWFTRRLCDDSTAVKLSDLDLVLCHCDLTCRNILWDEEQPPCLVDWASAGFYPRIFEKFCHHILGRPEDGNVVANIHLSDAENVQYWLIAKAFANDMRYCL